MSLSAQLVNLFSTEPVEDVRQCAAANDKIAPSDMRRITISAEKMSCSNREAGAATENISITDKAAIATAGFSPKRGGEPA